MFIKQSYNKQSIQYIGGIKFTSLITDGLVANGRRSEYSSLHVLPLDTQRNFQWQIKIPDSWEEDDTWCVVTQIKSNDVGGSPNLAVEILGSRMVIKVRDKNGKSHYVYDKPMVKGEWITFDAETRWTVIDNGYIRIDINGVREAEYSGSTIYEGATGAYFKCGIYMAKESKVVKREMLCRI